MRHIAIPFLAFLLAATLTGSAAAADPTRLNTARFAFRESMKKAQAAYRKALAGTLPEATKVEVFLLDFDDKSYPDAIDFNWDLHMKDDSFPIMAYNHATRILARKVLSPKEVKILMPVLQATVGVQKDEGGMACHLPIHGIRLWIGDQILFQTSFCWFCGNFDVKYPDGTSGWSNIEEPKLKKLINDLMPIPQAELERFKKTRDLPVDLKGK